MHFRTSRMTETWTWRGGFKLKKKIPFWDYVSQQAMLLDISKYPVELQLLRNKLFFNIYPRLAPKFAKQKLLFELLTHLPLPYTTRFTDRDIPPLLATEDQLGAVAHAFDPITQERLNRHSLCGASLVYIDVPVPTVVRSCLKKQSVSVCVQGRCTMCLYTPYMCVYNSSTWSNGATDPL